MNIQKVFLMIVVMATLVFGASVVGAQDNPPPGDQPARGPFADAIRAVVDIVADETGLEPRDILTQVQEGQTLADIIEANGGNVDEVVAQAVTVLTERINTAVSEGKITQERADRLLNNLETVIKRGIDGDLFPNKLDQQAVRKASERILMQAVTEATGLRPMEILRELRDGATLADVISANGGDVQAVIDAAVAKATEQINTAVADGRITQEQADQLLGSLEQVYTDAVNGQLGARAKEIAVGMAVIRLAADQTGLQPREILEQLRSGKTLAEILTAAGVDTSAFVDSAVTQAEERLSQAVENGRLTQERADELLIQFRDRLAESLNKSGPAANPGG